MMLGMRFEISYNVMIERSIDEVFPVLALGDDLERMLRLSPMLVRFSLLETRPGPTVSTQVLVFTFTERVPMVPGVYSTNIGMRCEQTVDSGAKRVDYRSRSTNGVQIVVHKVRTFESVGSRTRVSEVIHGEAPPGLHLIARRSARKQHRLHMDRYPELFEGAGA